jgi:bacillithiol biosynthesis cysteine-adding enzyme BshC
VTRSPSRSREAPSAWAKEVPFSELPKTTKLFSDYISDFSKVSAFYPGGDPFDDGSFDSVCARVADRALPRKEIAAILSMQNEMLDATPETLKNIESLEKEDCFVVTTGQQVGLFGGPLYTIYKALSAVRLADRLNQRGKGCFVPLFWLAADDHDQDEVTWAETLADNRVARVEYHPRDQEMGRSVSEIVLSGGITDLIEEWVALLPDAEFTPRVRMRLHESYRPGERFHIAFARWMTHLLGRFGVVILDPTEPSVKKLCAPVFRREFAEHQAATRLLVERSAALGGLGYHVQVQVRSGYLNLFHQGEEGPRAALQWNGKAFTARGADVEFAPDEVECELSGNPERFSPNVLLRPIVESSILPTVAYVGGAAEIAYFAQVSALYSHYDLPMPVVYPRHGITLVEPGVRKTLDRHSIALAELASRDDSLLNRLARDLVPGSLLRALADVRGAVEHGAERIEAELRDFDPTLIASAKTRLGRAKQAIGDLESKIGSAQKQKLGDLSSRIERARNAAMPNGELQERRLNLCYFLSKYGGDLIDSLYGLTGRDPRTHIMVDPMGTYEG